MRLRDADALNNMLSEAQAECKRNGGNFRFGVLSNVRENVAKLPTIDAIPVEWLETAIGRFRNAGRSDSVEIVQSLIRAWRYEEWLKEQLEAQLDCMARKIFEDMDEKDRDALIQKLGYVPWQNEQEAQDG